MYPLCTVLSNVSRAHQKNLRTVNLMKCNSHLINVENRSNIPHQKWLLKYLQLPAVQNPFYIDKKHVKFNLLHMFFCHISFSWNVLKSYQNPLTLPDWYHIDKMELHKWYVSRYNSYTDIIFTLKVVLKAFIFPGRMVKIVFLLFEYCCQRWNE